MSRYWGFRDSNLDGVFEIEAPMDDDGDYYHYRALGLPKGGTYIGPWIKASRRAIRRASRKWEAANVGEDKT